VENIREAARRDLGRALLGCFDMAIGLSLRAGEPVHPVTVNARNRLLLALNKD
jgi:HD superfamily phosphohydrolase YqeK